MIPRIIHYCWLGEIEIPEEETALIREWQLLNPDWEIRKWDDATIDLHIPYLAKAHENKHWANMSNYIRLRVLQQYGGIYLDTDVKLLKNLDPLCANACFLGFENDDADPANLWVNNAVMGAVQAHPFLDLCLQEIIKFDGSEPANISSPHLITRLLKTHYGLNKPGEQTIQDIRIYPREYFYSLPYSKVHLKDSFEQFITEKSYAVHFWKRSWLKTDDLLETLDSQTRYIDEQSIYINDLKERLEHFSGDGDGDQLILNKIDSLIHQNETLFLHMHKSNLASAATAESLNSIKNKQLLMEKITAETQTQLYESRVVHDFYSQKILRLESQINELIIDARVGKMHTIADFQQAERKTSQLEHQLGVHLEKIAAQEEALSHIGTLTGETLKQLKEITEDLEAMKSASKNSLPDMLTQSKEGMLSGNPKSGARQTIEHAETADVKEPADAVKRISAMENEQVLLHGHLSARNEEIEKLNFKVATLNTYVDNFANVRKQLEDRIWLLEEIIQDMRLVNRTKKLFGAYHSKVGHLIFKKD